MNRLLAILILLLPFAAATANGNEPAPGDPQAEVAPARGKPAPRAGDSGARPPPAKKPEKSLGAKPDTGPQPAPRNDEESEAVKAWHDADI